jgi:hypothetical protein
MYVYLLYEWLDLLSCFLAFLLYIVPKGDAWRLEKSVMPHDMPVSEE